MGDTSSSVECVDTMLIQPGAIVSYNQCLLFKWVSRSSFIC